MQLNESRASVLPAGSPDFFAAKGLSLFLFIEFEIICDSAGWMKGKNMLFTDGRMRLSESG